MRYITIISAMMIVAGCSSVEPYQGQGEYFELQNVNVIERDLSLFKPTLLVSANNIQPQAKLNKDNVPMTTHVVRQGERYQSAVIRWLNEAGYQNVAWSMGDTRLAVMDTAPKNPMTYTGSLKQAISELSAELGFPIRVITDKKSRVAGIYDFEGNARITHVKGNTIKEVVERVVKSYGFRWENGSGLSRSWVSANDYKFGADYYLLTGEHDIETALTVVLEDYPVYSEIVESTGQVIIREDS